MSYIDTHKLIAALRNGPTTLTPAELQDVLADIDAPNEKYNGWTNRETWSVHLWLTNEQDHYLNCVGLTADEIRAAMENILADVSNGIASEFECRMIADIGSLWRVDWDAIARALTED